MGNDDNDFDIYSDETDRILKFCNHKDNKCSLEPLYIVSSSIPSLKLDQMVVSTEPDNSKNIQIPIANIRSVFRDAKNSKHSCICIPLNNSNLSLVTTKKDCQLIDRLVLISEVLQGMKSLPNIGSGYPNNDGEFKIELNVDVVTLEQPVLATLDTHLKKIASWIEQCSADNQLQPMVMLQTMLTDNRGIEPWQVALAEIRWHSLANGVEVVPHHNNTEPKRCRLRLSPASSNETLVSQLNEELGRELHTNVENKYDIYRPIVKIPVRYNNSDRLNDTTTHVIDLVVLHTTPPWYRKEATEGWADNMEGDVTLENYNTVYTDILARCLNICSEKGDNILILQYMSPKCSQRLRNVFPELNGVSLERTVWEKIFVPAINPTLLKLKIALSIYIITGGNNLDITSDSLTKTQGVTIELYENFGLALSNALSIDNKKTIYVQTCGHPHGIPGGLGYTSECELELLMLRNSTIALTSTTFTNMTSRKGIIPNAIEFGIGPFEREVLEVDD